MKHIFEYLDFAEDREYAESATTKKLKLGHIERFAIRSLADDIKERGYVELVQPGGFDELVQIYEARDDGIEPLNCGVESRKVATAALPRIIRKPDLQYLEMVHEAIRIAEDLGAPVNVSLDC